MFLILPSVKTDGLRSVLSQHFYLKIVLWENILFVVFIFNMLIRKSTNSTLFSLLESK